MESASLCVLGDPPYAAVLRLSTCISGIWRLPGAPAGKGPAVSGFGRPEGHLRGSGEGLWGDDAAGLGGHTQFCAGVVSPQGAGGGKASWRQRPGYQTEGVPPGSCFSWDSLPVGGVGAEHWAREEDAPALSGEVS